MSGRVAISIPGRQVLMVGPSLGSRGGMASVCAEYQRAGLFERLGVIHLASFEDGSPMHKLRVACFALWRAWRLLAGGRTAVLHVHAATNTSFWRKTAFCLVARMHGVPCVLHLHSGDTPAFLERCSAVGRAIAIRVIRSAAVVVVVSPAWEHWLRHIAPRARIEVVPNPVQLHTDAARTARSPMPTVLFLGRLEEAKGVPELLGAFAKVLPTFPEATLFLCWEGDREGTLRRAQALSIEGSVKLPGWVSGQVKQDLLSASWIFVLPSHWEGLPVGMLEAMANGLPSVGTAVGGVPGLLGDSGAGLVVPVNQPDDLADAMLTLLGDGELRRDMGDRAISYVRQHCTTAPVERRLQAIYSSLNGRDGTH